MYPINEDNFLDLLSSSDGVITNAGFTTTSEALFLKKPLFVIPMKGQIEQIYNSVSLEKIGVKVSKKFSIEQLDEIDLWLNNLKEVKINFENNTKELVDQIALDFIKLKHKENLSINII